MTVHYDAVRIGKIHKDRFHERDLRMNLRFLKEEITEFLKDFQGNELHIELIIPGRGTRIKIALRNVKDKELKRMFQAEFPENIYKGKYSIVDESIFNPLFSINSRLSEKSVE